MAQQEKSLNMTILMTPDMVNFSGKVHGGHLLKLLDQAAYACAARYCKNYVVTVSLDQVSFKQSVHVGELVTLEARIHYTGRTSMEVGVKVIAENLQTKARRHTNSCYFTMVAVDAEGRPIPVPPIEIETDYERQLFDAAAIRRQLRQEIAERTQALEKWLTD